MKHSLSTLFDFKENKSNKFVYPLHENALSKQDLIEGAKVLISRQLTMSKKTIEFENYFRKKLGLNYCIMVNSGSSANLLAMFALINPKKKNRLKSGDECLIPAVCWSTSLWPIIQAGLKPKLVDVDINTFSMNLEFIKKNVSKKTKAIMMINVLGNCSEIDKIRDYAKKKSIYLIEDNCESLGSIYKKKYLGSFGDFSSFSFYYSHQITAGEGGMIACKSKEDYHLIKSLRAHGWDRDLKKKKNKNFNFINSGFNLRPLEISAAIGLNQFKRLNQLIKIRTFNRNKIISTLKNSSNWKGQFNFFQYDSKIKPSLFGFPLIINHKFKSNKKKFLDYLNKNNIETRPIISGNFANQPAMKLYKIKFDNKKLINSNIIDKRGFFIGLPTKKMKQKTLDKISELLLSVSKF
jgi:CDP-6-deoxy-D-xylo-4-hexulose-3-dehydrase|tara:strand:+ start:274 stop:1497 length:1224 start_codon:yes stop_codon:yes gene_type:complete